MNVILYNPLSKSGSKEYILKIVRKKLKLKNDEFILESLINISDTKEFMEKYIGVKSFIIFGGDGTLNVLANNIKDLNINANVYFYAAGTGNDFKRSVKINNKLIDLRLYLGNLPTITFNDETRYFINGVGMGLDAMVVNKVNNSKYKKSKFNYFRHSIESFIESKKTDVYINEELYKDTWFVSAMNDKYFGGGMKIAPKASRFNDTLDLVIVKKAPKWLLILIFPTIYLGWHTAFKKYVKVIRVKEATIKYVDQMFLQIDGEDYEKISEIKVKKEALRKVEE